MPIVSAAALHDSIARGDLGGTFFLHGEEAHLREEAVLAIVDAHLDPSTRDFNLDQFSGTSVDIQTFASACQTPPLLAEWRVVVLRDAQALAGSARFRAVLDDLAARPQPGLALIITGQIPGSPKAKVWSSLAKKARAAVLRPLPLGELPDWLIERAATTGMTLDPAAARALAAAAGPELGRLVQELGKLRDFAGDRTRISVDDVRKLVGFIPQQNRWDWFDTIGETRFADARRGLDILLGTDSAVGLLIGLGTHMLRIGLAVSGGESALADIMSYKQRWVAQRIARQARRWSVATVNAALDDMLRADRLLKSTSLDPLHVMDELLLRLQNRHAAAA